MAKERKNKSRPTAEGQAGEGQGGGDPSGRPAMWVRGLLSVAVAWHVLVVFLAPLSVQPASILVSSIAGSPYVRWYTDALYLNQGYHFFGPDPPRNQLVRYQVTDEAGAVVAEGEFPDKQAQRPRLYYHRHMMLADQAANGPPDVPPEEWLRLSLRAYGRHLLRRYDGQRVSVECVMHNPLSPRQSLEGVDPSDPGTFVSVARIEESAASLDEPLPVPPAPARDEAYGAEPLAPGGMP